jgi:sarcosine oxidase, subunit beta
VVVVGAGVAGLCTALYLARAGREVVVLERHEPWCDASGANAGTLSLQVKHPLAWDLTRLGIDLWEALAGEDGAVLGFARPGGLRVATSPREREALGAAVIAQRAHGIEVTLLEGADLRDEAPWLGEGVVAAALCPADAYCAPTRAGPGLLERVAAAGVRIRADAGVEAVEVLDRGFRLRTARDELRCEMLVIAAGAWTGEIAALLGVRLPVRVDVNMLSVTGPAPARLHRVVTHVGGVLSLKQYPNGTVVIGGGWQGRGDPRTGERGLDHERLLHNLRLAARVVPFLEDLPLVRAWAGYEAVAPDALPMIGALPGRPGAYVASCARGLYSQAPAHGLLLAELMTSHRPRIPLDAFDPGRFAA